MIVQLTNESRIDLKLFQENLNAFNGSGTDFIDKITRTMERLSSAPKLGASLNSKISIETDLRFLTFPFTKKQVYIIIYRVDEKANIVYINRVFDGRMNYLNTLFND